MTCCCRALRFLLTRGSQHSDTPVRQPSTRQRRVRRAQRSCLYEEGDGCDQQKTADLPWKDESLTWCPVRSFCLVTTYLNFQFKFQEIVLQFIRRGLRFVDRIAPIKSQSSLPRKKKLFSLCRLTARSIGYSKKKNTNHRRELAIRILIDPIEFGNINRNCAIPKRQRYLSLPWHLNRLQLKKVRRRAANVTNNPRRATVRIEGDRNRNGRRVIKATSTKC